MEPQNQSSAAPPRRIRNWVFNPFQYIAGFRALLLGVLIIIVSSLAAWPGELHFDGVLDFHIAGSFPVWVFFVEGFLDWICLAIPLYFFGLIISKSAVRIVDVFGTQALARGPYLIAAVVMLPEANRRFAEAAVQMAGQGPALLQNINYADMAIFIFASLVGLVMLVWMVALMYRAYAVSCNVKGPIAIITFIVSLIGAEIMAKAALALLMR